MKPCGFDIGNCLAATAPASLAMIETLLELDRITKKNGFLENSFSA